MARIYDEQLDFVVYVKMTKGQVARVDKLAKKLKMPRSTMVRNLMVSGLESAEFMGKFGVFDLVGFFRENNVRPVDILQLSEDIV